jgi:protein gp37
MNKIEWCNETFNPLVRCSRISAGCKNCYAATQAKSGRLQQFEQYQQVKD